MGYVPQNAQLNLVMLIISTLQVGDINVQTLISYTSFNDESGESPDRLVNFKRWLWATVEKMTPLEKQDLVYFWTGENIPTPSHLATV